MPPAWGFRGAQMTARSRRHSHAGEAHSVLQSGTGVGEMPCPEGRRFQDQRAQSATRILMGA
jgi:hypothetical protein